MSEDAINYAGMSAADLDSAESKAVTDFNTIADRDDVTAEQLSELTKLAESVNAIRGEKATRLANAQNIAELKSMVNAAQDTKSEELPVVAEETPPSEVAETVTDTPVLETVTASDVAKPKVDVRDVIRDGNNLNASLKASLSQAAVHSPSTPPPVAPAAASIMTASADIPGFAQGGQIATIDNLVAAMHARSRNLPDKSGYIPVATMHRKFRHELDDKATLTEIDNVIQEITDPSVLTAAGGWCAPSEISYNFYNIVCEDGLLDLPTVGINRGGLRFPTSASFGDVIGDVWTWTETQDIAAVTGTAQSGTKPCFRVPCPDYNEERLACDGICLTMGNLMNDAFPELVANHTRLLFAAQAHYTNARIIGQLVTGSTAVNYATTTGHGLGAPLLEAVEMQVIDYRTKFAMCNGAILEAVFPTWILPMFRADLAKRLGIAEFDVPDSRVIAWFNSRGVRVQLVQDWQVRASGLPGQSTAMTAWPATVTFLLFATGTWIRGNGMRLDLGVIRDSTLNQTNDFTAAWMEECYLTAKIGHESRLVTVPICPNGATQAGITMGCSL